MKKSTLIIALAAMSVTFSTRAEEPQAETKHWTRSGNASLQFTQGYVSKNWYKGGESNMALMASGEYNANYKKNRFAWDNKIEAKLGFVTTPSDEYHDYMTNHDLLKWTTKFGLEAAKNWYYTLQGVGQTQFCPGYKSNNEQEFSKFFSPAYLNIALGMDYKKSTDKITFSAFVGPIAYNLKFVGDPLRDDATAGSATAPVTKGKIDGTQFGLKYGQYNTYDMGASAKATMTWKICKYVTWSSNASYFSPLYGVGKEGNDGYTELQWENTFDMPLNKYFSTKLYACLRFDDSVGPENKSSGWGYFQCSELLSFGLSYNW